MRKSKRAFRIGVVATVFIIANFAAMPVKAATFTDSGASATEAGLTTSASRISPSQRGAQLALWWTRRCQSQQMPYCPYGAAYISGYNSCGRVWACGQSYIPDNSPQPYYVPNAPRWKE